MTVPLSFSVRSQRTTEQPINYYMQQAVENPQLISLAAGLVDAESLPIAEIGEAVHKILDDPEAARAALQYGTTPGHAPLREAVLRHVERLDALAPGALGVTPGEVVVTTGSQQLLYLLSEVLLDPGDIVMTESPSYFVHHSVLSCSGVHVRPVPMDHDGMNIAVLEEMLHRLQRAGQLRRVKMIYTCDYFQNPTGLTLSLPRRRALVDLAWRFSQRHRLVILEDAAYRELAFAPRSLPSVKSFDRDNQHVVYAGTFSKPCAPGLKTGYALLPPELIAPLLRFKGLHDFGSANLNQHLAEKLLTGGSYAGHVASLSAVYRSKCEAMLASLDAEFGAWPKVSWTRPDGGMFVWLRMPEGVPTGPGSRLLEAAVREGMLYVPGEFCHVPDERGHVRRNEMRLCYGVEPVERIREAVRRLRRAAEHARLNERVGV
jgi:2-aminoadipate transaminase